MVHVEGYLFLSLMWFRNRKGDKWHIANPKGYSLCGGFLKQRLFTQNENPPTGQRCTICQNKKLVMVTYQLPADTDDRNKTGLHDYAKRLLDFGHSGVGYHIQDNLLAELVNAAHEADNEKIGTTD